MDKADKIDFKVDLDTGIETLDAHYIKHKFAPHFHDTFAIGVVEDGVESFSYGRNQFHATAGSIICINPGEVHTGQAGVDGGWKYKMIYPSVEQIERLTHQKLEELPLVDGPVLFEQEILGKILYFHKITSSHKTQLEKESLIVEIFQDLFKKFRRKNIDDPSEANCEKKLLLIKDYILSYRQDNISIEQLSKESSWSGPHLIRMFKKRFGIAPHQYLLQARILSSKNLLKVNKIVDVGVESGFFDQSHFIKKFQSSVGMTPKLYKAQF